jgi:exodeoxyribonuclease VII large subunit
MTQLPLFEPLTWTVSEVTQYLRGIIGNDPAMQDLWVLGEVSNLSRPASGHLYFTVKDASATLRCVMWRNNVLRQASIPREGEAIEVHGFIDIYEAGGQYQLYADLIRPAGEGLLFQKFLRLKAQLEAEGLFDPARKRPIPEWPNCIGIVTSSSGAALRDMLNTIRRRYPLVTVVLAPTPVQGEDAPAGIRQALVALNRIVHPDVILLARGGGSIEDLWAFNDEGVARAIAASQAPVITGVGHETDFTIADFTADLRAPTPTAAAELATPDRLELLPTLEELGQRLGRVVRINLNSLDNTLENLRNRLQLNSPRIIIRNDRQRLDDFARRMSLGLGYHFQLDRAQLGGLEQRLSSLNPLSVLSRGYAVVTSQDGEVIRNTAQVAPGDKLDVRVSDGRFGVQVSGDGGKGSS